MSEDKDKKTKIVDHEPLKTLAEPYVISRPYAGMDDEENKVRLAVVAVVPNVEDGLEAMEVQAKNYFGDSCTIQYLLKTAVNTLITRVDFKGIMNENPDATFETLHTLFQNAVDDYQVNRPREKKVKGTYEDAIAIMARESGLDRETIEQAIQDAKEEEESL